MELLTVLYLLFLHWFADFFCQTDEMAKRKSNDFLFLLIHTMVYTFVMYIGVIIYTGIMYRDVIWAAPPLSIFLFGVGIFFTHLIIDYVTSKINKKLWNAKKVHWFFVSIGFDQWLHFVTIFVLYYFLKNA